MKHLLFLLFLTCITYNHPEKTSITKPLPEIDFYEKLCDAAVALTKDKVEYDPAYYTIPYPNGDIPKDKGVCTDVVIRAYRKLGIDLQKEVHIDMKQHFAFIS